MIRNLFRDIPNRLSDELVEILAAGDQVRVDLARDLAFVSHQERNTNGLFIESTLRSQAMARVHVSVITGEYDESLFIQSQSRERTENASNVPSDLLGEPAVDPTIDSTLELIVLPPHRTVGRYRQRAEIVLNGLWLARRDRKVVW